jgi:hypothetical protein
VEIVAGLLRHPSPISIDGSELCEYFPYVFEQLLMVSAMPRRMIGNAELLHVFDDDDPADRNDSIRGCCGRKAAPPALPSGLKDRCKVLDFAEASG